MRDAISTAGHHAKKARAATVLRDEWVRKAHAEGASFRAIGKATGLSHTAVKKIVDR